MNPRWLFLGGYGLFDWALWLDNTEALMVGILLFLFGFVYRSLSWHSQIKMQPT